MSRDARDNPEQEGFAQGRDLANALIVAIFVSFAAYVLNSYAVRQFLAEVNRLLEKFVL